ncbi:MAG: hypothetical protein ACR2L9_09470 [Solirubrobacteraceae bacterium]
MSPEDPPARDDELTQELTVPRTTPSATQSLAPDPDFPVVLRGYDRIAVDAYVREANQLVEDLQATRSPETAIRRALERVGDEVSAILQQAHDAAAQITADARNEAQQVREQAAREAAAITAQGRSQVIELGADTERIWTERQRIVQDARALAGELAALAEAADRLPPAAEDLSATQGLAMPRGPQSPEATSGPQSPEATSGPQEG